ncbi:hypothetical protein FUT69_04050 [Xylella taiwanensis]|uniref:Uncharacterized protein n=1 Tax=Xylella taiwanensis TaxID=1444770 RepID=Z9JNV0_9GAMM|nr:hypothetical protein [Xylella taiwanensis]AXI84425.1 hypothetical protein AB672_11075 [Xylella taiwanensis]EWS79471.1 hypothetical protein AF72_01055 [Xylella taiwanensis]MCD8455316.1 hypothetical protein [Xylella taiwanensis]MCD8457721.1 hypothetical protein [Xylella taiwanensis]MCD8459858.1 hypothetical protein [Xylella taiwanensis]
MRHKIGADAIGRKQKSTLKIYDHNMPAGEKMSVEFSGAPNSCKKSKGLDFSPNFMIFFKILPL